MQAIFLTAALGTLFAEVASINVQKCFECSYGNPYGRNYDPYAYGSSSGGQVGYDNRIGVADEAYDKYDKSRERQTGQRGDRQPQVAGAAPTGQRDKYDGTQWSSWRSTYYEHDDQNKWFSAIVNSEHLLLVNHLKCDEPPDLETWDEGMIKRDCAGPCVKATTRIKGVKVVKRYCHLRTTSDQIDWRKRDQYGCADELVSGYMTSLCYCQTDLCNGSERMHGLLCIAIGLIAVILR
ncbi:PREDICTED: uncharacterized protein LOC106804817 [Priapulus caudatus]|uniref:Uncharacterized protein LOC106804817 n=1 Tax=Priapulus caudatus TaxID=37621 RepID=A0ABM1DNX7_PRICU|nr:PREDICTED: uncharacterized protein LOC106804817 [Priapulus caudatus]